MLLPALHPIDTDRAVREGFACPQGRAVVSSMSTSPVEAQVTSFGFLDHRRLVMDTEILESGANKKSAPEELIGTGADPVLEIASWTGRLDWLRLGFVAILPLGRMALVSFFGSPSGRCCVARIATVVALALLARLLIRIRVLSRTHSLLGLLTFPFDLHELLHDLKFVVVLFQPTEAMLNVPVLD